MQWTETPIRRPAPQPRDPDHEEEVHHSEASGENLEVGRAPIDLGLDEDYSELENGLWECVSDMDTDVDNDDSY